MLVVEGWTSPSAKGSDFGSSGRIGKVRGVGHANRQLRPK
jgi:hypothetical protein